MTPLAIMCGMKLRDLYYEFMYYGYSKKEAALSAEILVQAIYG